MLDSIIQLLSRVDPKRLEERFPDQAKYDSYIQARSILMGVLKSVDDRKQISPELLMRMEKVSQEFRVLHECLSSKTELAGRSSINEIYHWVAAGHMERSIYLAGVARGRRLKEPYRTQIQLLPANACMFRYLQVKSIDNQKQLTDESLENNLNDVVLQMLHSLQYQMNYFAVEAYRESRNHPMASYIFAVSQLIMGESHEANSDSDNAQSFYNAAQTAINEITEPREGLHYMHAQYHKMNYDEFITLKPYYGKFPDIGARLKLLHEKATYLSKEGKISTPKDYYELTPYLVLGGRAASVIGLVVTAATLAGIDLDTIDNAIRSIWSDALRIIPGLDVEDVKSITLHGGGPAIELAQMFDFHGGGPA